MNKQPIEIISDVPCRAFYFLDYKSGGGYSISDDNNFVFNYKMGANQANASRLWYRDKAICDYANMLHSVLQGKACTVIPFPTSKPRGTPDFDDRLDLTAKKLRALSLNYDIQFCLDVSQSVTPAHNGGSRDCATIKSNLIWIPPTQTPRSNIVIFDDVITTGAHLQAVFDTILSYYPNSKIYAFFLAKTQYTTVLI